MPDTTLQAREDIRAVRRALINRASEIASELHRDVQQDRPPAPHALHGLVVLEQQISALTRLVREIEDFHAV